MVSVIMICRSLQLPLLVNSTGDPMDLVRGLPTGAAFHQERNSSVSIGEHGTQRSTVAEVLGLSQGVDELLEVRLIVDVQQLEESGSEFATTEVARLGVSLL